MSNHQYAFLDAQTPEDRVEVIEKALERDQMALKLCKGKNVRGAVARLWAVDHTAALWLDLHSVNGSYV